MTRSFKGDFANGSGGRAALDVWVHQERVYASTLEDMAAATLQMYFKE